jgi:hypothetical protein
MPDENQLTLEKVYDARGYLIAIEEELKSVKAQLASIPTRKELARIALLSLLLVITIASLVIAWIEVFPR